jgi:hypothetical protein
MAKKPSLINVGSNEYTSAFAITDADGDTLNITKGALDVAIQDQFTRAIILPFNKVTNSTTLSTAAVLGEYTITLTSVTGVSDGSFIILFNATSERFNFFYAVGGLRL